MAIYEYFGRPRAGKTTYATALAIKYQKQIESGKCKYRYVFTNFPIAYPGIYELKAVYLGKYLIEDSVLIIDEAQLLFDSRKFKNFTEAFNKFFMMHGHYSIDVHVFTQIADGLDKKIRQITERVFYVHKGAIRRWITYINPIPYECAPPKNDFGDIISGYMQAGFLTRLLSPRIKRKKYYKYFDSFDKDRSLPPVPLQAWFDDGKDSDDNNQK